MSATQIFTNRNAEGQSRIKAELIILVIDLGEPKSQLQAQAPRTGLAHNCLPDRRRPRRLDRQDVQVKEFAPFLRAR